MNPDPAHNTCDAPEEAEEPAPVGPPPDLEPFVTLPATRAAATITPPSRRVTEAVARLLSAGGAWDGGRGRVGSSGPSAFMRPPGWVWDALATSAPEVSAVAAEAVDAATAAGYFGAGGGPAAALASAAVLAAAGAAAPACLGGALAQLVPGLVEPLSVKEVG